MAAIAFDAQSNGAHTSSGDARDVKLARLVPFGQPADGEQLRHVFLRQFSAVNGVAVARAGRSSVSHAGLHDARSADGLRGRENFDARDVDIARHVDRRHDQRCNVVRADGFVAVIEFGLRVLLADLVR